MRKPKPGANEAEFELAHVRDVRRLLRLAIKRLDAREKWLLKLRKVDGGRAGSPEERAVLGETMAACAAFGEELSGQQQLEAEYQAAVAARLGDDDDPGFSL
jgi:hypothetical protein